MILLIRNVPLYAREKAQDKKIEKTAMELKDLAKKVDQTSFMQRFLHFWKFKRWLFGG
ncbi:MAG TPA: hypothetical protein VJ462_02410 [Thermodesulfobacteriota bacterium]|nr:hypothetical protein [Thermodesulfobacteriota bacterium]